MQPTDYCKNIKQHENGIWKTAEISKVSYPEEGNRSAIQIEDHSFWFQHRLSCIIEIFERFPPCGPVLDVGGGNGQVSMGLQNTGFEPILLEPGYHGVLNAKKRGVRNIIHGGLENVDLFDKSLPAISLFDVLEHMEDEKGILNLISKKIMIGGRLYLTVPAYNFLWSHEDRYAGHFRRYRLNQIKKLLADRGFKTEFSTYLFSFLVVPLFFYKALPYFMHFKRDFRGVAASKKEHLTSDSKLKNHILNYLKLEKWALKKQKAIPFGTTCLVVATKVKEGSQYLNENQN